MSHKWSTSLVYPGPTCAATPQILEAQSALSPDLLTTSINCHPGATPAIQGNTGNSNGPEDKSHHVYSDGHALHFTYTDSLFP